MYTSEFNTPMKKTINYCMIKLIMFAAVLVVGHYRSFATSLVRHEALYRVATVHQLSPVGIRPDEPGLCNSKYCKTAAFLIGAEYAEIPLQW